MFEKWLKFDKIQRHKKQDRQYYDRNVLVTTTKRFNER